MKIKSCTRSFFFVMLFPIFLCFGACADLNETKPASPAPAPIVLSPDYERVTALITRLEALEIQRTSSQPRLQDIPSSDHYVEFPQASPPLKSAVESGKIHLDPWTEFRIGSVPRFTVDVRDATRSIYISLPHVAENGSYYREPNANGIPKTVQVDGYYRRDGTYVRSHFRSAPGSNPR